MHKKAEQDVFSPISPQKDDPSGPAIKAGERLDERSEIWVGHGANWWGLITTLSPGWQTYRLPD